MSRWGGGALDKIKPELSPHLRVAVEDCIRSRWIRLGNVGSKRSKQYLQTKENFLESKQRRRQAGDIQG